MTTPGPKPYLTPAGPVLRMSGVTVAALRDPSRILLEDVNWTVNGGEYWAIGGLLLSGKTDLLGVAGGLQRPAQGELLLFGEPAISDQEDDHLAVRRRVGFVFDGGQLLHGLTLAENVALPLRYHFAGDDADLASRLDALIALTSLEPWSQRRPAEVSRNWQQRFGLARALALKPELLLLDDPLSGLDPRDAEWWLDTLEALSKGHALLDKKSLTLIVTGNDLRPWRGRARQFALLQDQKFIALGDRAALDAPCEPALAELLRPWHS